MNALIVMKCKSRFCPSCANKYALKWLNLFYKNIISVNTDILFLLFLIFYSHFLEKIENYISGIIAILHTYGRDLKWNPHIHTIVIEGTMGNNNVFKKFDFISYDALRKHFQKILLDLLEKKLGKKKFKDIKNSIYLKSNKDFYIYAKKNNSKNVSTKDMIQYAIRYTGKPAMAESRILDYDGEYVTFWYQRHEDNQFVTERVHVYNFFKRLIIHIPDQNFKTVRYYRIYSKKYKFHDKMVVLIQSPMKKI